CPLHQLRAMQADRRCDFWQPYLADAPNNRHNPLIDPARIAALRANEDILREVRWLKWGFMTRAEALVHGDLHTGSIMVTHTRAWGIAYAAQPAHNPDPKQHAAYQEYLLQTLAEVWQGFATRFATQSASRSAK